MLTMGARSHSLLSCPVRIRITLHGPSGVSHSKAARSAAEVEVFAHGLLSQSSPVSTAQVQRLFNLAPDSDMHADFVAEGKGADLASKCFITGAYVFNGAPNTAFEFPCVATAAMRSSSIRATPSHLWPCSETCAHRHRQMSRMRRVR